MSIVRSKLSLSVIGLLVICVAAASAYAVAGNSSQPAPSLKWNIPTTVGEQINPTAGTETFAARSGVTLGSIRQIVAASSGLSLIVGENSAGRPCTASAGTAVSNFNCLSDWSDKFAMLLYSTDGGSTPFVADHASVVGIARPDVAKVVVKTAAGTESTLTLNAGRGFSYDSSSASTLPVSITAYDQNRGTLETEQVEPSPQSG
jgi:hypothetical protein